MNNFPNQTQNITQKFVLGESYDRRKIAFILGYKGFHAIAKGVVTPQNAGLIILFVTKEKQDCLTQYNDFIDGNFLFWEGEARHGNDLRIINAEKNGEIIILFYRDRHHSDFVFMGELSLVEKKIRDSKPSEFIFSLKSFLGNERMNLYDSIDSRSHEFMCLKETEKEQLSKVRIGQDNFRKNLIRIWGKCSVSGVENLHFLNASHIKPWSFSSNDERLNPFNGFLLNPSLDTAFDKGFISFDQDGKILISNKFSRDDAQKMAINQNLRLLKVIEENRGFLHWHREKKFIS